MRQKHILVILLAFVASVLQAAQVNKNDALQKAERFVAGRQAAARGAAAQTPSLQAAYDSNYFYVFNIGGDGGFVIVSGDDRTPEILGYSDAGTFDAQNIPDNMRAFLQGYADEIAHMPETATAASRGVGQKRVAKSPIAPFIRTSWGQDSPYNQKVPDFFSYGKSVTGCVATAMAQVLYHVSSNSFGFPTATTAVISAYTCSRNWGSSGQVSVPQVSVTTFDWTNMCLSYSGSETTAQNDAVADLMLCCGASVEMDYANQASGGSSASLASIPHALKTYFGFDNSVKYRNRNLYTTAEWEDMVYTELAEGRPVLYGGQSSGGGHAFVCDGYDGDGFYHINWGWKGTNDGFFLLAALNPYDNNGIGASSSFDGYSMRQDAIIGLQAPSGDTEEEEVRITVNKLAYNSSTVTYNKSSVPLYYSYSLTNNLSDTYDVTVSCDLFDADNNIVKSLTTWHVMNSTNNVYWDRWQSGATMSGSGSVGNFNLSSLSPGTYKIKLRSKLTSDSDDKYYECINADKYYIQAVVTETQVTFSTVTPLVSLTASDIALTTDGVVNTVQTVSAKITNNGEAYHGSIYLFVDNQKVSGNGLSVEAGQKAMAYFSFKPTTAGTKTVKICTDENGSNQIGTGSITINTTAAAEGVSFTNKVYIDVDLSSLTNADMNSYTVDDDKNVNVILYSSSTNVYYKIVNHTSQSVSYVAVRLAKYNENSGNYEEVGGYSAFGSSAFPANTAVGISSPLSISEYGKYEIHLYKNIQGWGDFTSANLLDKHFRFELTKGYSEWNSDGEKVIVPVSGDTPVISETALSAEIDGTAFSDVTPNSNPNTLYVITNGSVPASLSGKNVVTGSTASTINLTDGNSFATPVDFTASEINYTRSITTGTDGSGSGWTTIVLPFDVDEVWAVDGEGSEQIDWFHSLSDTNGRFWVRKFLNDGTNSVTFDYTDKIEANTPYIIAVPGNKWGSQWDLTGKQLVFKATGASISAGEKPVVTGNCYKFLGAMKSQSVSDVYVLNGAGSSFVNTSAGTVEPFRAYFKSTAISNVSSLYITSPSDNTTAIGQLPADIATPEAIYTLDGRRLTTTPKHGVYIKNGKKMVK